MEGANGWSMELVLGRGTFQWLQEFCSESFVQQGKRFVRNPWKAIEGYSKEKYPILVKPNLEQRFSKSNVGVIGASLSIASPKNSKFHGNKQIL